MSQLILSLAGKDLEYWLEEYEVWHFLRPPKMGCFRVCSPNCCLGLSHVYGRIISEDKIRAVSNVLVVDIITSSRRGFGSVIDQLLVAFDRVYISYFRRLGQLICVLKLIHGNLKDNFLRKSIFSLFNQIVIMSRVEKSTMLQKEIKRMFIYGMAKKIKKTYIYYGQKNIEGENVPFRALWTKAAFSICNSLEGKMMGSCSRVEKTRIPLLSPVSRNHWSPRRDTPPTFPSRVGLDQVNW